MQYGIYIDAARCMGCFACIVACKDLHDLPAGPASWIRVKTTERGRFPHLSVSFLPLLCFHCRQPACLEACPAQAVSKRAEDGIVVVDREACLGKDSCGLCLEACPYDAPQFWTEDNPKMQKCDLCLDRLQKGEKAFCALSCPMEAIVIGPLEELQARFGKERETEGFTFDPNLEPSVVFKAKRVSSALRPCREYITPEKEGVFGGGDGGRSG
jgi:anaerobic dimethyl sulfoxide reductase subunit B (iron-sulfur subunit)